jgi:hypothetical protein
MWRALADHGEPTAVGPRFASGVPSGEAVPGPALLKLFPNARQRGVVPQTY